MAQLSDNLRGSLFMVAAMAGFAIEDMFLKQAVRHMPLGEVLVLFGTGGLAAFAAMSVLRGEPVVVRAMVSRVMLLRSGFELTGRLSYTAALALVPLATASAILQAAPLVVVAGAAAVFGEKVGPRRWTAIALGFLGVLLVLRPGIDGFVPAALLALLGMAGFAGRDLATRAAPPAMSSAQLGTLGFAVVVTAGLALSLLGGAPTLPPVHALASVAGAAGFGVAAYLALTLAMRTGEVSVVTPFRYTRLVFAVIIGVVIFAERPDAMTLAGAALIAGSGIYTLLRSRRRGTRP